MKNQATRLTGEQLLTKKDVARRSKYSERSVNYWMESGRLAYIKLGRGVRFLPADVEAFIQSHRIGVAK